MPKPIRIRAKLKHDVTTIKTLITHPMETGLRKKKETGEVVPAHFIKEVVCELNGQEVMNALWSSRISKNPYFSFKFKGGKTGDKIKVRWEDNLGNKDSAEVSIK
ncbi:MAG: thiosulfate oxidation carrier complex protein SoxZ [Gammaproteobacteria bacterium]|nr:thiosulfate oxidation carrier complex protein SoxZ [Gammaproteobacteria bacterium]